LSDIQFSPQNQIRQDRQPCEGGPVLRLAFWLAVFAAVAGRSWSAESDPSPPFRIAFSSGLFTDVNENDAKAALRIWGQTLPREQGIEMDPEFRIFKDQILSGLRELHATPAGQQVLTLFQSEKLEERLASCLQSACDLLAAHNRLCSPINQATADQAVLARTEEEGREK
jgi:hypothetical protein